LAPIAPAEKVEVAVPPLITSTLLVLDLFSKKSPSCITSSPISATTFALSVLLRLRVSKIVVDLEKSAKAVARLGVAVARLPFVGTLPNENNTSFDLESTACIDLSAFTRAATKGSMNAVENLDRVRFSSISAA
jgi:hypothetical protein